MSQRAWKSIGGIQRMAPACCDTSSISSVRRPLASACRDNGPSRILRRFCAPAPSRTEDFVPVPGGMRSAKSVEASKRRCVDWPC